MAVATTAVVITVAVTTAAVIMAADTTVDTAVAMDMVEGITVDMAVSGHGGHGHGRYFHGGRWWSGYGVGPCWERTPAGWIWICN